MQRLIKFGSIGLVIAGAIAVCGDASAIAPVFIQQDGTWRVGVSGTPGSTKVITFSGGAIAKSATIRVNECGFAKIANPSAYTEGAITVNAQTFNVATTKASAVVVEPTCVNGVAANLPASGLAHNLGKGAILLRGLPTSRVLDLTYNSYDPVTRTLTMNACGYALTPRVVGATTTQVDGVTVSSTPPAALYSCSNNVLFAFAFAGGGNLAPIDALPAISRTAENRIIIKTAPSIKVSVVFDGATITKTLTGDRCNGLYLPATATGTVTVNGVSVNTSALPVRAGQETCTYDANSASYGNSWGASAKWSDGRTYLKNYPGLTLGDRSIVTLQSVGTRTASPTSNNCGIASVASTATAPITPTTELNYNGTNYTVSDLPLIAAAPKCSTNGLSVPTT